MSAPATSAPGWGAWALRAAIYAGFGAVLYWWHPFLGKLAALFIAVDLLHHAADTARRRAGYRPIPRHPGMPGAPKRGPKAKLRPLLLIFGLVWGAVALASRALLETDWADAGLQALVVAGLCAAVAAVVFPLTATGLLWVMGLTVGLILSLGDLLGRVQREARLDWHRRIDQADHHLADLVLGQPAYLPLRMGLADRITDEARARR